MSINKVVISGNLTRDSELRSTAGGTSVLGFGVAVNDRRRNINGEWEDYANFVDCTMFGARADGLHKYLVKGTKVAIEGKLRWSQWESKDGTGKRSKIEIIVDELEFMSRNPMGATQSSSQPMSQNVGDMGSSSVPQSAAAVDSQPAASPIPAAPDLSVYDEEIPF